jgi:hypothetical protein
MCNFVYTVSGLDAFFREDYRTEVHSIFDLMYYYEKDTYQIKPIPVDNYQIFKEFATSQPDSWKRILQHVYTHDTVNGKKMYDMIKQAIQYEDSMGEDAFNALKAHHRFMSEFYRLKRLQTTVTAPNFGACEYCIKYLGQFPKVKKFKKFLKNSNIMMWDLFSRSSESK